MLKTGPCDNCRRTSSDRVKQGDFELCPECWQAMSGQRLHGDTCGSCGGAMDKQLCHKCWAAERLGLNMPPRRAAKPRIITSLQQRIENHETAGFPTWLLLTMVAVFAFLLGVAVALG